MKEDIIYSMGKFGKLDPSALEEKVKENHKRRKLQQTQQGHFTPLDKPYVPIGGINDKEIVEYKIVMSQTFYQWRQAQETRNKKSNLNKSDEETWPVPSNVPAKQYLSKAAFIKRKDKYDTGSLEDALTRGRNRLKNVEMGHGLFDLMTEEEEAKKKAIMKVKNAIIEHEVNEMHPPKIEGTDEGETVIPKPAEQDMKQYLAVYEGRPRSTRSSKENRASSLTKKVSIGGRSVSALSLASSEENATGQRFLSANLKAMASMVTKTAMLSMRKKVDNSRPYTPNYANIGNSEFIYADKCAIFRQICCLNWILEAIDHQNPSTIPWNSLKTCWNLDEVRGSKNNKNKMVDRKRIEASFLKLVHNPTKLNKRNGGKLIAHKNVPRRTSIESRVRSNSHTTPSVVSSRRSSIQDIPEPDEILNESQESVRSSHTNDTVSTIKTNYNIPSVIKKEEGDGAMEKDIDLISIENGGSANDPNLKPPIEVKKERKKKKPRPDSLHKVSNKYLNIVLKDENGADQTVEQYFRNLDEMSKGEGYARMHDLAHPKDRMSAKELRAEYNIRAKKTPAVQEYICNKLKSRTRETLVSDVRQNFDDLIKETEMTLNDTLETRDHRRIRVLKSKFKHMSADEVGSHRAIEKMRNDFISEEQLKKKEIESSQTHQAWFMDLLNTIPETLKQEWYFSKMLHLLSKFGRIDSGRPNAFRFLNVIGGLKEWEICSPDVSAAIEFCRSKIIDMDIESYEKWFINKFPKIQRPKTAAT